MTKTSPISKYQITYVYSDDTDTVLVDVVPATSPLVALNILLAREKRKESDLYAVSILNKGSAL